jgi:hypothetical protein
VEVYTPPQTNKKSNQTASKQPSKLTSKGISTFVDDESLLADSGLLDEKNSDEGTKSSSSNKDKKEENKDKKSLFSKIGDGFKAVWKTIKKAAYAVKEFFVSVWDNVSHFFVGTVAHAEDLSHDGGSQTSSSEGNDSNGASAKIYHGGDPKKWQDFYNEVSHPDPDYKMDTASHVQYEYDKAGNRKKKLQMAKRRPTITMPETK